MSHQAGLAIIAKQPVLYLLGERLFSGIVHPAYEDANAFLKETSYGQFIQPNCKRSSVLKLALKKPRSLSPDRIRHP